MNELNNHEDWELPPHRSPAIGNWTGGGAGSREQAHQRPHVAQENPYGTAASSGYFSSYQEASAWSMNNQGVAFTRSQDGQGFVPASARGQMSTRRLETPVTPPPHSYVDKRVEDAPRKTMDWEEEEPPF